jgi:hypothetical protein
MSYYDTIDDDVKRAKEILERGKPAHDEVAYLAEPMRVAALGNGGAIHGADIYAAYKLLESFVAEIEQLRPAYSVAARLVGTLQARVEDLEKESDDAGKGWAECIALNKQLMAEVAAAERALAREQERRALGHD